nr:MAG TPA: hypothetical protein [Caudoviricetes sp.]
MRAEPAIITHFPRLVNPFLKNFLFSSFCTKIKFSILHKKQKSNLLRLLL